MTKQIKIDDDELIEAFASMYYRMSRACKNQYDAIEEANEFSFSNPFIMGMECEYGDKKYQLVLELKEIMNE